ncbi:MAG: TIGR01212 family radical SAM protein [Erysipelotrichales bacterium]|nr:TIGR01212 family radical SAM protein [Erysipelotrichales bacterium]
MFKHYLTVDNYYKGKYQRKVIRIPLDGNFTCPNIDGTKSTDGCTYCFREVNPLAKLSLTEQFQTQKALLEKKWTNENYYIAYFQAQSNTYGSIEKLTSLYHEALLLDKNIIGLSIASRPDCFTDEIYDLLNKLNKKTNLTIELGLQTINAKTAEKINRAHTLEEFEKCVAKLKEKNISVIVHIINGLPGETEKDMLDTVLYLNKFRLYGIKIHMLFIAKSTKMGLEFQEKGFPILSLEDYVDIVVKQIRLLDPKTVIYRLTGDAPKEQLISPLWSLKKFVVMNEIDKKMRALSAFQGDQYEIL